METEVGWKMGGRKRRGGGREGKKRKTFLRPCSAETRFQGIATISTGQWNQTSLAPPCSAETRFQGIATGAAGCRKDGDNKSCSAETRFQGIATNRSRNPTTHSPELAVLRSVFRGLRQNQQSLPSRRRINSPCSAETRFQGIATRLRSNGTRSERSCLQC